MAGAACTIGLVVRGSLIRVDLPVVCAEASALFATSRGCLVPCDVADRPADLATVEALARLALIAHRHDCRLVLRNASEELRETLELLGLTEVLPTQP